MPANLGLEDWVVFEILKCLVSGLVLQSCLPCAAKPKVAVLFFHGWSDEAVNGKVLMFILFRVMGLTRSIWFLGARMKLNDPIISVFAM